ncbi:hypothetical protein ACHAWX_006073 [Stephanocyclus meneghinianus]
MTHSHILPPLVLEYFLFLCWSRRWNQHGHYCHPC